MLTTLPPYRLGNSRNPLHLSTPREVRDEFNPEPYEFANLLRGGNEARFERGISEEIRKTVPELKARGEFVPWEIFTRGEGALSQRDMVAGSPGAGSSFIQTQRLPQIVDALRPHSVVIQSGCMVLDNLSDNISVPRWQTPSNPASLAETAAVTSSTQTTSLMQLSAHRVSAMTIVSRQLLLQGSNMALESLIKTEMLRSIGAAIDAYVLSGSGTGNQPLGVLNWPANIAGQRDLGKTQAKITFGATPTWAQLAGFPGIIEQTDVMDDGTMAWVVSPLTKQKWATETKITGFPSYLLENDRVAGYPLRSTNTLGAAHQTIFGRFGSTRIR